jgi:molybdenum cofactor guanylyltransferase
MIGLILCGGQSSRMGSDKGLLKHEAHTWAQTAVDKMAELSIPVKLSVNSTQLPHYATVFPAADLITDTSDLQIRGPLLGLLSAHLQYPTEDIFILACDMPLMETPILKELLNNYHQQTGPDAFVFADGNEPEPLCGIYKSTGLKSIIQLYHSGQLVRHSMKFMLDHINTFLIPIKDEQKKAFRNFNAHAELNGL